MAPQVNRLRRNSPGLRFLQTVLNVAGDAATAPAAKIARGGIQVIDGDTIHTDGLTYRLVGFSNLAADLVDVVSVAV
jgi:hypothetical protein